MNDTILIADSGSTKTDWLLLTPRGERLRWTTGGLNPYFHDQAGITRVSREGWIDQELDLQIGAVFFYGSGCGDSLKRDEIADALQSVWPEASIRVDTDLMGAARAVLGSEAGVACILGTGCNSCRYDGIRILDQVPSLGYVFGDEGSGVWIGKELIRRYFYREMPPQLSGAFEDEYDMNRDRILHAVYHEAQANRFIAGFAAFAIHHADNEWVIALLDESIDVFVRAHILKYKNLQGLPVGFVGSIAAMQTERITRILHTYDLEPSVFLKSPMEGLVAFHQKGS